MAWHTPPLNSLDVRISRYKPPSSACFQTWPCSYAVCDHVDRPDSSDARSESSYGIDRLFSGI